jgi:hypothetical protein
LSINKRVKAELYTILRKRKEKGRAEQLGDNQRGYPTFQQSNLNGLFNNLNSSKIQQLIIA